MLRGFVGLMSERGSGSAFGYKVLNACCPGASSVVQPVNGLGPEATTGGLADAAETSTSPATHAAPKAEKARIDSPFVDFLRPYSCARSRARCRVRPDPANAP